MPVVEFNKRKFASAEEMKTLTLAHCEVVRLAGSL